MRILVASSETQMGACVTYTISAKDSNRFGARIMLCFVGFGRFAQLGIFAWVLTHKFVAVSGSECEARSY